MRVMSIITRLHNRYCTPGRMKVLSILHIVSTGVLWIIFFTSR